MSSSSAAPAVATEAVFSPTVGSMGQQKVDLPEVKGFQLDSSEPLDWDRMFEQLKRMGFQATNVGLAIEKINEMLRWRLSDDPVEDEQDESWHDLELRKRTRAKIFLGYTSNQISCGMREYLVFLAKHKLVDVIVTTGGGIEEDFIKAMAPTFVGDFHKDKGEVLRKQGLNRIGNLIIPNNNYCLFEEWIMPILDAMLEEQIASRNDEEPIVWTPSKMIRRLGEEIGKSHANYEESVYYWCWKNDIPVFCPAITDGSLGDMIYFHSFRRTERLVVDIARDIRALNTQVVFEKKTGQIILGGGLVKHHICNANLMRNGADWSVFINTGQEFDGSDSGARPDEAVSWGKIRLGVEGVKVYGETTLIFPTVVGMSFFKYQREKEQKEKEPGYILAKPVHSD